MRIRAATGVHLTLTANRSRLDIVTMLKRCVLRSMSRFQRGGFPFERTSGSAPGGGGAGRGRKNRGRKPPRATTISPRSKTFGLGVSQSHGWRARVAHAWYTSTSRWRRLRKEILERDQYECRIGGPKCQRDATDADHIIPVEDGGPVWDPENLRAACHWCNVWRAQEQKKRRGWKRATTRITLIVGPPGAGDLFTAYIADHAGPHDLVIDYWAIARAIGDRPDEIRRVRGTLLSNLRRGSVEAPRAWVTSTNPRARELFPYHQVVELDPGKDRALTGAGPEGTGLVEAWYAAGTAPAAEEWKW
jgi:hypothetical protein